MAFSPKIDSLDGQNYGLPRLGSRLDRRGVEKTGWIDLLTGINAFKRSTGEYLVFVEENHKAKSVVYRWKP